MTCPTPFQISDAFGQGRVRVPKNLKIMGEMPDKKWYSKSTQTHLLLPELIKTPKKPTWTRPITNSTPISQKSEKTIRPAFNEEGFECISYMYVCRYIHIYLLAPKKFCWTKFIFHMVSFLSFLQQNSLCPLKNFFEGSQI